MTQKRALAIRAAMTQSPKRGQITCDVSRDALLAVNAYDAAHTGWTFLINIMLKYPPLLLFPARALIRSAIGVAGQH